MDATNMRRYDNITDKLKNTDKQAQMQHDNSN